MFTGIIEETGKVKSVKHASRSSVMTFSAHVVLGDLRIGDSINTSGVCLTVTRFDGNSFTADVMPETVRRTTLKDLKSGDPVNLERALPLNGRLGGHLVSGHIDGTGIIRAIRQEENAIWLSISVDRSMSRYIVEKGSVAIDGISLTVARADDSSFDVSVIPHTLKTTSLDSKKVGNLVNIECDIIAKYTEKLLGTQVTGSKITKEFLEENDY